MNCKFYIHFHQQILTVTQGQIEYAMQHLLKKVKTRDFNKYHNKVNNKGIEPHPLHRIIKGETEEWEIV